MALPIAAGGGSAGPPGFPSANLVHPGSAMPSMMVAVWEWLDEFNHWRPYSGQVSSYIEYCLQQQRGQRAGGMGPTSNSISLGQADPTLAPYIIDIPNLMQFRQDTGTMRKVRRRLFPQNSAPGKGVHWEWANNDGGWTGYEVDISIVLEDSYMNRQQIADLAAFNYHYVVDLTSMFQINTSTGFRRQVRRRTDFPYPLAQTPGPVHLGATCSCHYCLSNSGAGPITSRNRHSLGHTGMSSTSTSASLRALTAAPNPGYVPYPRRPLSVGAMPVSSPNFNVNLALHQPAAAGAMGVTPPLRPTAAKFISVPSVPVQLKGSSGINPALAGVTVPVGMTAILMSAAGLPVLFTRTPQPTSTAAIGKPAKKHDSVRKSKKMPKKVTQQEPEEVVKKYTERLETPPDESCIICMEKLSCASGYDEMSKSNTMQASAVGKLTKCGHVFHLLCMLAMYNNGNKDGSLQCPSCKAIYGEKTGTQPKGRMDVNLISHSLPGHPDCGTIQIVYTISPGIQGPEHPNPGKPYSARGFPRHCYLPDNEKGRKVLQLLKVAWDRRLIFTVGTSSTTGEMDTVVWNEIHHKTEMGSNTSGHGYPDPSYLDNVIAELGAQGVTENCLSK
ncbi:probable E3 ubiquitin-protein ligase DTX2 isoform X1 [Latimeria chalumnae]|uniref:probable E3 ubiquitin-protein ligase DTX2 isoform X1 n=1 Tax=Latimeria chalumnae TaxID=7897 RepID=UPI0003C17866|nr:PREDICTED: probable E3 ubiquitin-protein ligase DTX2 isoform X1 [Latimeria chalumnae]|eukprot:XP_005986906.1 PREDICTED: probable E3 ubiquitin-protein ligase DTX2 isoform X1 [Latimeria chalumnae]